MNHLLLSKGLISPIELLALEGSEEQLCWRHQVHVWSEEHQWYLLLLQNLKDIL